MNYERIGTERFLELAGTFPVLDVRSPGEYAHAHIPGAHSFPLFSDEERKKVGTAYKQESRETAIKIGLDFFGPKMRGMVEAAEQIIAAGDHPDKTILVHCWRGGMRSGAVSWLLSLYGFRVYTLEGGYKAFRRWIIGHFSKEYPFRVIGGYTGSGKTDVLQELHKSGRCVLDLEKLAAHRGSAFGKTGQPQPGQEMFENLLGMALHQLPCEEPVWIEDESQRIGDVNIPIQLWHHMRSRPLYFLDIPFDQRLDRIVEEYGNTDRERLVNSIIRIKKRLGPLETKTAVHHLIEDNVRDCFAILLRYYDKQYRKALEGRTQELIRSAACTGTDARTNTRTLLNLYQDEP